MDVFEMDIKCLVMLTQCCPFYEHAFSHLCHQVVNNALSMYVCSCFRAPLPPSSVQVVDSDNKPHTLHVQVLGTEETWHTPSLLLATVSGGGGKVVFSQVHLEVDPMQYEDEESKFAALKESNTARLEIIQDLLSTHLGLECFSSQNMPSYTPGYFLGRHEVGTVVVLMLLSHSSHFIFFIHIFYFPIYLFFFFPLMFPLFVLYFIHS
jgi:hypothetical protein